MLAINEHTRGKLSEQAVFPKRKFIFNGVDETERAEVLPAISRSAKDVSAGSCVVEVFNGDKYWNKIKDNLSTYLRQEGKIQLEIFTRDGLYLNRWGNKTWDNLKWYSGEDLDIFTGKLEDIEFREDMAFLTFRDKMAYLFDKKAGSEEAPVDFYSATGWGTRDYSSGINPADMVWYLLTDAGLGGLDNTTSSANVDIDYDQWSLWKSKMTTLGFLLQGNFTGQSIGEILGKIKTLSHSTFFAEGDGKIYCRYWLGEIDASGSGDFDTNNIFSKPILTINSENIINRVTVFYGYDPDTAGTPPDPTWAGHVDKDSNASLEDTTSQSVYGLRDITYEDTVVWIPDSTAADAFGEREITWWKDPKQEMEFIAGLMGFPHQLSDALRVEYPLLNIYFSTDKGFALQDITMNIMNGTVSWKSREIDIVSYFILDHATLGLLDKSYNPLF